MGQELEMAWIYLFIAGLSEVCWAVSIKHCDGIRPSLPMLLVAIAIILSIVCFGNAVKSIPMSVAYAIWTGIGIVGLFIYGAFILKEPVSISNVIFVSMILIGIIGLKLQVK